MLTLSQLRPTRVSKGLTRNQLAELTALDPQRLKALELRTAEPWFDEACLLSRVLLTTIPNLITSGSLTLIDCGEPTPRDGDVWRSGARVPLSLACRVAKTFGLDDPAELSQGSLARQIWEVIGANDRHPEHAGLCPWCTADIALGDAHLPTCLPNNLWSAAALPGDAAEAPAALAPETKAVRSKAIPAHNLRAPRLAKNMIQTEVAKLLDVHPNYYARMERGTVPLTIEHANVLADYYGVDRAALYYAPERV